jgi:hypothetical protein
VASPHFASPGETWRNVGDLSRFDTRVGSQGPVLDFSQVGEFLHQLLRFMLREHHDKLGIFTVAFRHEDCAFTDFLLADALNRIWLS